MANNKHGHGKEVAIGLGVAAAAAAIAGAYYFYGKEGAKHRKNLKSWAVRARGEILEKLENLENISRKNYEAVVTQVLHKYKAIKNIDPAELQELTDELKGHWHGINQTLSKAAKVTVKKAKRAVKK